MAKSQRRARKLSDPNQLNLLDYVPASSPAKVSAGPRIKAEGTWSTMAEIKPNSAATPNVMTAQQAAHYLSLSLATLKSWRAKKIGPTFVKRGARLIGYLPADLDAYLKNQR